MNCEHCGEPILPTDRVDEMTVNGCMVHFECGARGAIGSLAHVEGRCSCYVPGADELDPPHMTRRQAAKAALEAYMRRHRCK